MGDIKVIALTHMLEIRHIGSDEHLKKEPSVKKTVEFYKPGSDQAQNSNNLAGFYKPDDEEEDEDEEDSGTREEMLEQESNEDQEDIEEIDEDDDDDDEGWITPSNLKAKKLEMLGANGVP